MTPEIDAILLRVGCGKSTWRDETKLRQLIRTLEAQVADANDRARRAEQAKEQEPL